MKFAVVPNRVTMIDGREVTPCDQIATIECDLPVRDVIALLQFRKASLVQMELGAVPAAVIEPPAGELEAEPAGETVEPPAGELPPEPPAAKPKRKSKPKPKS